MIEVILKHNQISQDWFSKESPSGDHEIQHWRFQHRQGVWKPLTDVYENEEAIVVRVEIGGMREEDFSIFLEKRHLLIQGNRADTLERRAYYQMEIPYGEFITEIDLPLPVTAEGVTAVYRDGFLKIVLPKVRSHLIQIKES